MVPPSVVRMVRQVETALCGVRGVVAGDVIRKLVVFFSHGMGMENSASDQKKRHPLPAVARSPVQTLMSELLKHGCG